MLRIIGDSFCDVVAASMESLPKLGGDVLANISLVAGGSGINSAIHGANFCSFREIPLDIELVTAVGRDFQGEICIRAVIHDKIKLTCARDHGHGTGTCIVLSGRSDRSFVTDRAAVGEMSLQWYGDSIQSFEGITHVHAAGFFNCTKLMTELPEYFRLAFENGVTTSLNPQYDATENWDGGIQCMAPFLTVFICNELELLACANPKDKISGKQIFDRVDTLSAAAERVLNWGCQIVVATRGADGASVFTKDDSESPILEVVEPAIFLKNGVVDSTGAGDSFCGAFLCEWINSRRNNVSAAQSGLLAGAACVSINGGSSIPNVDLLNELSIAQNILPANENDGTARS